MQNKALYAFESSSLGKGLKLTQEVLENLNLQLHGAHPLAGGGFLFIAFEAGSKASGQEFLSLVEKERGIILESPSPKLVKGLLHLQPDPGQDATGVIVLESESPTLLLTTLNDHLQLSGLQLYQLNLGVKNKPFAVIAVSGVVSLNSVETSPQVTRTYIEKLSPEWRKQYFI